MDVDALLRDDAAARYLASIRDPTKRAKLAPGIVDSRLKQLHAYASSIKRENFRNSFLARLEVVESAVKQAGAVNQHTTSEADRVINTLKPLISAGKSSAGTSTAQEVVEACLTDMLKAAVEQRPQCELEATRYVQREAARGVNTGFQLAIPEAANYSFELLRLFCESVQQPVPSWSEFAQSKKNLATCMQTDASTAALFALFRFRQSMLDLASCKAALPDLDLGMYSLVSVFKGVETMGVVTGISIHHSHPAGGNVERAVKYRVWDLVSLQWHYLQPAGNEYKAIYRTPATLDGSFKEAFEVPESIMFNAKTGTTWATNTALHYYLSDKGVPAAPGDNQSKLKKLVLQQLVKECTASLSDLLKQPPEASVTALQVSVASLKRPAGIARGVARKG